LASQFGIKAFEMVLNKEFGKMVAFRQPDVISVPFTEAISQYNYVKTDNYLINTARGLG